MTNNRMHIDREEFYELIFFTQNEAGIISDRIFRTIDADDNGSVVVSVTRDQFRGVHLVLQYPDSR